jgi:hypothetical protein
MPSISYVKKITASLGWLRSLTAVSDPQTGEILRPASEPQPVMRIKGIINEGWEEAGERNNFVRLVGQFQAQVVNRDGSFTFYHSRNLILPAVAEDYLLMSLDHAREETNIKGRTGLVYRPRKQTEVGSELANFDHLKFAMDLWIKAPHGEKISATGYEFECRPIIEAGATNPLDEIAADAGNFAAPALPALEPATQHDPGKKHLAKKMEAA